MTTQSQYHCVNEQNASTFFRPDNFSPRNQSSTDPMSFQVIVRQFVIFDRLEIQPIHWYYGFSELLNGIEILRDRRLSMTAKEERKNIPEGVN
jgi:hypothetical protein